VHSARNISVTNSGGVTTNILIGSFTVN
jgi:hypothetical protein